MTRFALFALFASCGDGPPAASSRTSSAVTAEGAMTHVALDLGDRHGCVLRSDGRVFCWGNNQRRQANPASAATTVPSVASAAAVLAPDGADLFAAELSVSNQTSCARRADGAVFCWGSDDHGVISGTASPGVNRPATLVPLTTGTETRTARGIGLGWRHLCAVRDDGQIACRGDNNRRQLGDTTPPPAGQMVLVRVSAFSPLFNAAKVVSGDEHSCALLADGQVFCWGDWQATNGVGTLATLVTSNVVDITAGDNHTCALHADHVITCWGANESGQLGNNSTTASATPVLVQGFPTGEAPLAITAGARHTCAIFTNDRTHCWGANNRGQSGFPLATIRTTIVTTPVTTNGTSGLSGSLQVAAGSEFTCVSRFNTPGVNDGSLQCWGAGDQGQLGDNNTSDSTVARNSFTPNIQCGFSSAISSPHNGPLIDSGDNHSCVFAEVTGCGANGIVDYHRGVMCWGRNDFGQLGRNSTSTSSGTPAPVFGLDANILSLATGANHTCVVDVRGRVFCWGINNQGQCALPLTTASVSVPTQVNLSGKAVQVTAGLEFTCALLTNGTVQCWGANNFGMLGRTTPINVAFNSTPVPFDGSPSPFPAPVLCGECTGGAQALTNVVQVSAGDDVVCARIATGEVRCWGHNLSATGAFGTAAAEATRILGCGNDPRFCGCGTTGMWCMAGFGEPPGSVRSMGILPHAGRVNCNFNNPSLRALSVSAHALGACLVQPNGVTQCWGPNTNGVLGDNNSGVSAQLLRDVRLEVPEPGNTILNNVTNLSGGVMTKCALRNNGSALCWGFSSMGQAGTIATAVNTAHRVAGTGGAAIENFIAVAPGFGHSCGMTASGGVRCWGTNNYQVLGRELATIPPPASSPAALPVIFAQ